MLQDPDTLPDREERFRAFLSATSEIIYRMSPDWSEMRYLQGKHFIADQEDSSPAWLDKYIFPEDQPKVMAAIRNAIQAKINFELEHRVRRVDGTPGWVFSRAIPILDPAGEIIEWFGAAVDITARKQAEAALRTSEQRYRTLFDAAPIAVFVCDTNAVILDYNRRAVELWGREPARGVDKHCGSVRLWLPDGRQLPHEQSPVVDVLRTGEPAFDVEVYIERPDGSRLPVLVNFAALKDANGEVTGAMASFVEISQRKRAEEAMRQSEARARDREERLNMALAASATGTFRWNPYTGTFLEFDQNLKRLFGFKPDEPVRVTEDFISRVHPDDVAALIPAVDACRRGADFEMEYRAILPDGSVRWIYDRAKMERDSTGAPTYLVGACTDITQRKQAEQSLQESEQRFRALANTIPNLAWVANADGWIFWYNERWYEYTGTTPEQMQGWGWQSVHSPDVLPLVLERWKRSLATGEPFEMTFPLRGANGRFRPFLTRVMPLLDDRGRVVRWFGTNTDITEQKSMEEALRRANSDLEQFAYSASHDLQEPIRNICLYADIIKRRYAHALDSNGKESLDFLVAATLRLEALIGDLLAYTRAATIPHEPSQVADANMALKAALSNLAESIRRAHAEIHAGELPKLPVQQVELQQLFQNLIGNSIKYRKDDLPPRIVIRAERGNGMWRFSVQDNGIGIAPEYHEQVFGLFKRLHGGAKYAGSGIGLAICRKIVERRGGRIWIESNEGEGATLFFTLPARE
jgi:PAS domain S-box-containing protein